MPPYRLTKPLPNPLGKLVAQVVVLGVSILSRALPAAYAAALKNARKSGAADEASSNTADGSGGMGMGAELLGRKRMRKDEALQVLNLSEGEVTMDSVQKQYDRYFAANAVERGGSFYLQSKVYRAKELLDQLEKEQREAEAAKKSQGSSGEKMQEEGEDEEAKRR